MGMPPPQAKASAARIIAPASPPVALESLQDLMNDPTVMAYALNAVDGGVTTGQADPVMLQLMAEARKNDRMDSGVLAGLSLKE